MTNDSLYHYAIWVVRGGVLSAPVRLTEQYIVMHVSRLSLVLLGETHGRREHPCPYHPDRIVVEGVVAQPRVDRDVPRALVDECAVRWIERRDAELAHDLDGVERPRIRPRRLTCSSPAATSALATGLRGGTPGVMLVCLTAESSEPRSTQTL